MVIIKTCCCFSNVWKGSYACGIYTLIFDSLTIASEINNILAIDGYLNGDSQPKGIMFEMGYATKNHMIFSIVNAVVCCCIVVASIILVIGLHLNKREFLVPWLSIMIVDLFWSLIHSCYVSFGGTGGPKHLVALTFGIYLVVLMLNVYCIICVISQYRFYGERFTNPNRNVAGDAYVNTWNNSSAGGAI